MSSTNYENPLFRFWCPIRNFQKKKYTAASGEKHEVTKFNGEPSQAESLFKKTKVQFARVAHAMVWSKKEALYELQHEIITEGQCKLTKALKKAESTLKTVTTKTSKTSLRKCMCTMVKNWNRKGEIMRETSY